MSKVRKPGVILVIVALMASAGANEPVDDFTAFGTVENCGAGISIDGDLGAVIDEEGDSPLNLYDFETGELESLGLASSDRVSAACLREGKVAYIVTRGSWPDRTTTLEVYDLATEETTETGLSVQPWWREIPMRFFDGDRIVYADASDGEVKVYSLSQETVTSTGQTGSDPTISGSTIAYEIYESYWSRTVAFYDLDTGTATEIEAGTCPVVAGDVIAYLVPSGTWDWEARYYRLDSGNSYDLGLEQVQVVATDGRRIAIGLEEGPIHVYDISTGVLTNTWRLPCWGGQPCWLEIEGEYVAHERYEGGVEWWDGTEWKEFPEEDLNGDGRTGSDCAGGYFVWPLDDSPADGIDALRAKLAEMDLDSGITTSLDAKLSTALRAIEDDNERDDVAGANALKAFVNQVKALNSGQISASAADELIADAEEILDLL